MPRQPEAGSQVLLAYLLERDGLRPDDVELAALARTETDAALAVLEGKADAAFGLRGLARQYGLAFVPIVQERFDLLVDRRAWFEPPMQRLVAFCRTPAFATKAEELQGYDVSGFGIKMDLAFPGEFTYVDDNAAYFGSVVPMPLITANNF